MIRFPAEWEKQSAVLIAWPHLTGDFTQLLESVEETYATIAKTIAAYQKLLIVCHDDEHEMHIKKLIGVEPNVDYIIARINDTWVRDTVFLTVENDGQLELLNHRFNGWGNKYPHQDDNALNDKLIAQAPFKGCRHHAFDFILEGGSVESDGQGTLMTTRQCLLNPNRNTHLDQQGIENHLKRCFGVERIFWLDQERLAGDDTDAHIDTLARFCSETAIAYTSCDDSGNRHYRGLKNMEKQLQALRTRQGDPYQLTPLPLPKPIYDEDGDPLPANYSNFLIINQAVLAPVYDDPMDDIVIQRLIDCFPDRKVIPIYCRPLLFQFGSLHCMSMQFPEGLLNFD